MAYLTGNWKVRASDVENGERAIAFPFLQGSGGGGAGYSNLGWGLLGFSVNALNSAISIGTYSVMSAFFGSTTVEASGYRFTPIFIQDMGAGSVAHKTYATASITGSNVMFFPVRLTINAAATASTYTGSWAAGVSVSVNFFFLAFIVSGP